MKVIRLILLLPLDVLITLSLLIGLMDFKHNILTESETTETSEVK